MIKQNPEDRNCGQCCLATILGISLEDAIKLVGHNKPTKSKELIKYFNSSKNKRGIPEDSGLCILRDKPKGNWHWVVKMGEGIYDPMLGFIMDFKEYQLKYPEFRITSHFEIISFVNYIYKEETA